MSRWIVTFSFLFLSTPLWAERVVFVDPKHGYLIIDKLPGELQPFPSDRLCLLSKEGFIFTCEATVLVNNVRLAIQLPRRVLRQQQIASNQIIYAKNIFVMQQGTFNAARANATFNPAVAKPESMDAALLELATKQEKLLARLIPIAGKERGSSEKKGRPEDPGIAGLPLTKEKRFGEVQGGIESKEPRTPYDPEFVAYMKKIEQDMTKLPDLSKLKVRYTIKDGELQKIPRQQRLAQRNEKISELKNRYRGPLKHTQLSLVRLESVMSTFSYNSLGFSSVGEESERKSLWESTDTVARSNGGIGLNLTFFIGPHSFVTFGGRYKVFNKRSQKSLLFENRSDQAVTASTEASSFGFSTDYGWSFFDDGPYDLELFSGVDLENSSIDFKAIRRSLVEEGDSEIIGYGQSTLNVLNLRFGLTNRLFVGSFNFFLGVIVYVPVYELSYSFDGEVTVPDGLGLEKSGEDDLKDSLDHRSTSVGVDASLGISFRF